MNTINQTANFQDTDKRIDGIVTSGSVDDNVIDLSSERKRKSKKDDAKKANDKNDLEKGKGGKFISNEVGEEINGKSQNISIDNDCSNNGNKTEMSEGNNNKSKERIDNYSIGVNNNSIDNDRSNLITNEKVIEAMDIVNNTLNTVNDAINTVNEAIKKDGMDDIIHQIEELTVSGSFNEEKTQKNSETGEREVNIDNTKTDIGSKDEYRSSKQYIDEYHKLQDTPNTNSIDDITNKNTITVTVKSNPNNPENNSKLSTIVDTGNHDTQLIKENEPNVYCNKCFNMKLNGVCLCSNVNLYNQLLAKSNLSKSDSRKNFSETDSSASVDLSTAIALINR